MWTKNYGHEVALMDVSLNIQPGRIIGLLGPNGSGKTTIIKLINGLLQPSLGNIYIHGQLPSPASKKVVSYLPDTTYLNENMKIIDAINYFQDFMQILMSNELTNCSTICICIQIKN